MDVPLTLAQGRAGFEAEHIGAATGLAHAKTHQKLTFDQARQIVLFLLFCSSF